MVYSCVLEFNGNMNISFFVSPVFIAAFFCLSSLFLSVTLSIRGTKAYRRPFPFLLSFQLHNLIANPVHHFRRNIQMRYHAQHLWTERNR